MLFRRGASSASESAPGSVPLAENEEDVDEEEEEEAAEEEEETVAALDEGPPLAALVSCCCAALRFCKARRADTARKCFEASPPNEGGAARRTGEAEDMTAMA